MLDLSEADLDFDLGAIGFSVAEIDLMIGTGSVEDTEFEEIPPEPGHQFLFLVTVATCATIPSSAAAPSTLPFDER